MQWLLLALIGPVAAYTTALQFVDYTYINIGELNTNFRGYQQGYIGPGVDGVSDLIVGYQYDDLPSGDITITRACTTLLNYQGTITDKTITVAPVRLPSTDWSSVTWNTMDMYNGITGDEDEALPDYAESTVVSAGQSTSVTVNVGISTINRWMSGTYRNSEEMVLLSSGSNREPGLSYP